MNQPDATIIQQIDNAINKNFCLVLYKDPWADYFRFLIAKSARRIHTFEDLNGEKGWIFTPFRMDHNQPGYVVVPEASGIDWFNLSQELSRSVWEDSATLPTISAPLVQDSKKRYCDAFEQFQRAIQSQHFSKLVLARSSRHQFMNKVSPATLFQKACEQYPRMMTYLCHIPEVGTWIGSTPEILLAGHPGTLETVSLAGTMPISADSDEATWNNKNKQEQRIVSSYIKETLKGIGIRVKERGPFTARAGKLLHIKTEFIFDFDKMSTLGNLIRQLYPTPAVNGYPKREAYNFILKNEHFNRNFYSGLCGWVEPEAITDIYVNLRCMQVYADAAELYAGGGIVRNSVMEAEWDETNEKLKTMSAIL